MAGHVNKSWSSFQVSGKENPNPRNSETSNLMRRSFSGNPFVKPSISTKAKGFIPKTPANSPSNLTPRKSFSGRENLMSFNDDEYKENGKEYNLKQSRIRSPADLKGTKHFMSPTISASSKVIVSPRKEVLMERNEYAGTSVSTCSVKTPTRKVTFSETIGEIDFKPEIGFEEKKLQASSDMLYREEILTGPLNLEDLKSEEVHHSNQPSSTQIEPELLPYDETVTDDHDCVNLDPTFNISPTPPPVSSFYSTSEMLAPLDAVPLMPPYDPKTNYLSPRPQFLHYRPNPRVELYKEKEEVQIEECFSYGSSSDVEENQSDDSPKGSDDFSSQGIVEEEGFVTDLSPNDVETERRKGSMFTRSKFIALLLVLSVVGLSISVSNLPVSESLVFEDLRLYYKTFYLSDASMAAKEKLEGLARDLHVLYANSLSLFSAAVSNFVEAQELEPYPYCNLTVLLDNPIDGYLTFDHSGSKEMVETLQLSLQEVNSAEDGTPQEMEIMKDIEEDSEYGEQEQGNVMVTVNHGSEQDEEELGVMEEEIVDASRAHFAHSTYEELGSMGDSSRGHFESTHEEMPQHDDIAEPVFGSEKTEAPSEGFSSNQAFEEQEDLASGTAEKGSEALPREEAIGSSLISVAELAKSEDFDIGKAEVIEFSQREPEQEQENAGDVNRENDLFSAADIELQAEAKEISSVSIEEEQQESKAEVSFQPLLMAVMLLVLPLGAAASLYFRTRKGKSLKQFEASPEVVLSKESGFQHVESTTPDNASIDLPYSRNCTTEVDGADESCPSEMSGFEISRSSLFPKESKWPSEVHKNMDEKKTKNNYRRESFASSSSEYSTEPSYGSFTTFEKMQIKNEKCLTPVRRSSRIRKATSPL